jgi:hypothetical protein
LEVLKQQRYQQDNKKMQHGYCSAVVTKAKTGETKQLALFKHNLLTDAGEAWMHAQVYTNTAAGTRAAGYIAATETSITPAVGNTTLTGEITDRGMPRADATTKTYTGGSNSTIIEHTFTVSGAGFTSVLASALFNAASVGTMPHIATFTTGSGILAANDTLKITWTLVLG